MQSPPADPTSQTPPQTPPPVLRRRRRVLLGIGLFVLLATAALATDLARQRSAIETIAWAGPAELARTVQRPTLIRFTADWCPPCQAMKRDVFSLPELAAGLETRYRAVSVDGTHPSTEVQNLAIRHAVRGYPTFIVLAPDGTETARLEGGANAEHFAAFLDRHAAP